MRTMTKLLMLLCLLVAERGAFAQSAGTVTYVYTDPQGTPLAEADTSGNITATFDYTPYGTTALGTPPNGPGYTGHVNDPETNLVYMQARYYDPATGHFLSTDPLPPSAGDAFKFNRYAYVNNNPIMGIDPTGMDGDEDCGVACNVMRRISDAMSQISNSNPASTHENPHNPTSQLQVASNSVDNAIAGAIADAAGGVAPIADAIPGVTAVACATGADCTTGDWVMAGFGVFPGEGAEANEIAPFVEDAVHGNSALSTRITYLYRLTTDDGEFLKWGISSNPEQRYTVKEMIGKKMQLFTSGSRRQMLDLEKWIVQRDPGPLNRERWAGKALENGTVHDGP